MTDVQGWSRGGDLHPCTGQATEAVSANMQVNHQMGHSQVRTETGSGVEDSTPAPPLEAQVLYRFYDETGQLLYVGITLDPSTRFGDHRRRKAWWPTVTTIRLERHTTREDVLEAERLAILSEHPLHNVIHNGPDRCPACLRPSTYDAHLDRYFHRDPAVANEPCWWQILRTDPLAQDGAR